MKARIAVALLALAVSDATAQRPMVERQPHAEAGAAAAFLGGERGRFADQPSRVDARNVTIEYQRDRIIPLLAHHSEVLHVEFDEDDGKVNEIMLGDAEPWQLDVHQGKVARVFIKPKTAEPVSTSGTIVTDNRVYEIRLIAVPEGVRYQRVTFKHPKESMLAFQRAKAKTDAIQQEMVRHEALGVGVPSPREDLNFDYTITGRAEFKPQSVYDDGKFTTIVFPAHLQTLPVVFQTVGKQVQLVDYVPLTAPSGVIRIQVQRLVEGLLLKLDKEEVTIARGARKSAWSWFN